MPVPVESTPSPDLLFHETSLVKMESRCDLEWGLAKGVCSILKPKIKSLHKSKLQDSVLMCLFELEKAIDPECSKKKKSGGR